jgi:hypothetical protein
VSEPLSIAQVTPYAWESDHEVNVHVARLSGELRARGHRVVVLAPSRDSERVRRSRALLREGRFDEDVLFVGEVLPELPTSTRRRAPGLPVDLARTLEDLMTRAAFDVVHVHEPFAPSVASAALRHSRALNVGTFHAPAERLISTQVARKVVELVFGRLDARLASFRATADLMERFFPGDYRVRIAFIDREERGALRLFLRALRRLDLALPWEVTVVSDRGPSSSTPLRPELRERVTYVEGGDAEVLARSDVLVAASDGAAPAPGLLLQAIAANITPRSPS